MTSTMTKGEREDLQRLVRQRQSVLKSAAKLRSSELLADFENQIASEFAFDDDAIWAEAAKAAEVEVAKAQKRVKVRCSELRIPERFAPSLKLVWSIRGYDNSVKSRREELRKVAEKQVEALERKAIVEIEMAAVEAQTDLAVSGLDSEAALGFVKRLPTVASLMPGLSYQEIAGEAAPPVVEQLVTPNALRQRRFRERQQALHNGEVTPEPALRDATDQADPTA